MRSLGAASRAALAAVVVGAMITLAGCGGQVAAGHSAAAGGGAGAPRPGSGALAGVALCRDVPALTSVVISRTMAVHRFAPGLILLRGVTIGEPPAVRGLAAALWRLPKMPPGPVTCPAHTRGWLRFAFAAGRRLFPSVIVQMSGCRVVTGLGPARTARSAVFWRAVGQDLSSDFR
jgi:hypothetical protein